MTQLRLKTIVVTPFSQNCLLIWNERTRHGSVIDPGGEIEKISEEIEHFSLTIDHIILTHGHIDHIGGATHLAQKLQIPIIGPHKADQSLLENAPLQAQMFALDAPVLPVTPERFLEEGDTLPIAGAMFSVFHCPGHAPGHIILVQREEKIAILGDVLFKGSVGRTDLPGGSAQELKRSLREKIMPLDDAITFYPGHGPSSTLGYEKKTNPFLVRL